MKKNLVLQLWRMTRLFEEPRVVFHTSEIFELQRICAMNANECDFNHTYYINHTCLE